jgi:ATP-dependent protease ClpP protease subunit
MQHFVKQAPPTAVSDDDLDDEPQSSTGPRPKRGFSRVFPVKIHNFYLYEDIGAPDKYLEMIHTIRTAEANDQIYIHLNTSGGRLDTGISLLSAMAECQGTIITVLDSTACSMGAILFLAGHQYIVHDFSMLMFHTFSGGFYGKSGDVDKQVQAYKRQYTMIVKKVCSKFLTADEIRRIDHGEEMWFASDLIGKRLKNLEKVILEEHEQAQQRRVPKSKSTKPAITAEVLESVQ